MRIEILLLNNNGHCEKPLCKRIIIFDIQHHKGRWQPCNWGGLNIRHLIYIHQKHSIFDNVLDYIYQIQNCNVCFTFSFDRSSSRYNGPLKVLSHLLLFHLAQRHGAQQLLRFTTTVSIQMKAAQLNYRTWTQLNASHANECQSCIGQAGNLSRLVGWRYWIKLLSFPHQSFVCFLRYLVGRSRMWHMGQAYLLWGHFVSSGWEGKFPVASYWTNTPHKLLPDHISSFVPTPPFAFLRE